jgi:hypothetical protein
MTYRSGGERGSYPKPISKKLGSDHTSLFTSLRPAVLISVSKSTHSSTWFPATPAKANVGIHLPRGVVESDIPLYWIGCEGFPPKTAILVWCRSNIPVVKREQVDAQLPLPTENNQPSGLNGETLLPITMLLQDHTLVSETERKESQHSLEVKRRGFGNRHTRRWAKVLVTA